MGPTPCGAPAHTTHTHTSHTWTYLAGSMNIVKLLLNGSSNSPVLSLLLKCFDLQLFICLSFPPRPVWLRAARMAGQLADLPREAGCGCPLIPGRVLASTHRRVCPRHTLPQPPFLTAEPWFSQNMLLALADAKQLSASAPQLRNHRSSALFHSKELLFAPQSNSFCFFLCQPVLWIFT